MFEDVRPALFNVTLHASLPVRLSQTREVEGAVRAVAIGAFYEPLRNAVVNRQRELGLNRAMAGEANRRLRLLQQAVMEPANLVRQVWSLKEVALRVAEIAFALILH